MGEKKFLIVDDEYSWRRTFEKRVGGQGVSYVSVSTVEEAIGKLQDGNVTDVITDGMKGRWSDIVEQADDSVQVTLVSADDYSDHNLVANGRVVFVDKGDY